MDELTLVREFADDTPLPDDARLAPARALLAQEFQGPKRRGLRIAGWSTAVVAAGAAAVLVITGLGAPAPPPVVTEGGGVPVVADAAQVLHEAADAARKGPGGVPAPDQFVYTRNAGSGFSEELWLSVDGEHDGRSGDFVIPGCHDGRAAVYLDGTKPVPGQTQPCTKDPGYDPTLPTDADGMVAYLTRGTGETNTMAKTGLWLLRSHYLPAKVKAALFEALTRIPGLSVHPDVTDASGRRGTGVAWSFGGGTTVMVFDARTHQFLGTGDEALLVSKVVDKVGQR